MKIIHQDKVVNARETYNAKYAQPYPPASDEVKLGNKKTDLVFVTNDVILDIDGVEYTGSVVYMLFKS